MNPNSRSTKSLKKQEKKTKKKKVFNGEGKDEKGQIWFRMSKNIVECTFIMIYNDFQVFF